MRIDRTVTVDQPIDAVFRYLSDFTNTNEWDPGTVETTRQSGDGGVGSRYHNVSKFLGRRTELTYVITQSEEPTLLQVRGENDTVVATDTMRLANAPDGGTEIGYRADFAFNGLARFLAPLAAPAFRRLGDEAERGLRDALRAPGS